MPGYLPNGLLHRVAPQVELPRNPRGLDQLLHAGDKQYYGGTDYAAGVVKINGVAKLAFVRLYDQTTGILVAQKWTDRIGVFRFDNIAVDRKYFAVAFDPVTGEKAEIFDQL